MKKSVAGIAVRLAVVCGAAAMLLSAVQPVAARGKSVRRGTIHGVLENPAGQGLSGVISLCSRDGAKIHQFATTRHENGHFLLKSILPGKYLLHVDSIAGELTGLDRPRDVEFEVLSGKTVRPRLVAEPRL